MYLYIFKYVKFYLEICFELCYKIENLGEKRVFRILILEIYRLLKYNFKVFLVYIRYILVLFYYKGSFVFICCLFFNYMVKLGS